MLKGKLARRINFSLMAGGFSFGVYRWYLAYRYYGWTVLVVIPFLWWGLSWMIGRLGETGGATDVDIEKIVRDQKQWSKSCEGEKE